MSSSPPLTNGHYAKALNQSLTRKQQPNRVRADRLNDVCCGHFSSGAHLSGLVPRSQKDGRQEADKVRFHGRSALPAVSADVEQEALGACGSGVVLQQGLDEEEGGFLALRRRGFTAGSRQLREEAEFLT